MDILEVRRVGWNGLEKPQSSWGVRRLGQSALAQVVQSLRDKRPQRDHNPAAAQNECAYSNA